MEFCLLGPILVRCGGVVTLVPSSRQRTVLATLLLHANRVVSVADLADALWGSKPPPSAYVTVQNHVARLRKTIGTPDRPLISTHPGGYMIAAAAGELDVARFEALLGTARAAAREGSWAAAATQAEAALKLWRGEPLAGLDCDTLAAREVPRLTEMRWQATETRIDAKLHLGQHAEVIPELRQLVDADPLRENLHAQLILALYRDGRRGEALAAYQNARRLVLDELGAEPGDRLRELHQRMLAEDSRPASPEPEPGMPVPRQLPAAVPHFVGRVAEMTTLTELVDQAGSEGPGTVLISAIRGTAGVGKTALAVHWAHLVAERFPDGQLYVNLRGHDPAEPATATEALAGFLRALGVPASDIPAGEPERAAQYRSLLAGRRILVVADNAESVEQVRPLLPGAPGCTALVTSRNTMAGLVAREGAARLDLDLLPQQDAVGLLRALISSRASVDETALATLAVQCCRLPLALRVAAQLVGARPAASVPELVRELADEQQRLDLLDADGDPRTAVRAVFSWSYRHLEADVARTFRLASLHPGPDLDPYAVAALAATTVEEADRMLSLLATTHLAQPTGASRYALHDLLRAYGRELALEHTAAEERHAAVTGLLDYYLHAAATAMNTLFPADHDRRPGISPSGSQTPPAVRSPALARAWLDAERATLVAVAAHGAARGWPGHAIRLAATLHRYFDVGGHFPEAITVHRHARAAASEAGDRAAEAAALISLGVADIQLDHYQQATGRLAQALALYRSLGDRMGEVRALGNLGIAEFRTGHYQQASTRFEQALAMYRATGDRVGEARALANLGVADLRLGRYQEAAGHLQRTLELSCAMGDWFGECWALANLGLVDLWQDRCQQAADRLYQALGLCRAAGSPAGTAYTLASLGQVELRLGRHERAADRLREALALSQEAGEPSDEAQVRNGLGRILVASGRPQDARAQHAAALALAIRIGDRYEQACAHDGLAHSDHALGDPAQARRHWEQALALFTELGTPEARRIRSQLGADAGAVSAQS